MTNSRVFLSIVFMKLMAAAVAIPEKQTVGRAVSAPGRHAFFRGGAAGGAGARRVFGGAAAALAEWPAACALLDARGAVRCSGGALAPRWVLTAAHCVTPALAYVKYNTRRPASADGNVTAVHLLYRHPQYKVEQKDEGRGLDVITLHHDVGLVRTRDAIELASANDYVLNNLQFPNPYELCSENVKVLGFGRTEKSVLGEELFAVRLRLVRCERGGWRHCACGADGPRGVCAGDSGGTVLCGAVPIGVTSMGPVECGQAGGVPPAGATSVFTVLSPYADIINNTILEAETALRMRVIAGAGRCRCDAHALLLYLYILLNF